jgi:hypothetical protein
MTTSRPTRSRSAVLRTFIVRLGPLAGAEQNSAGAAAWGPPPAGPVSTPSAHPAPCSFLCPCSIEFPGETA